MASSVVQVDDGERRLCRVCWIENRYGYRSCDRRRNSDSDLRACAPYSGWPRSAHRRAWCACHWHSVEHLYNNCGDRRRMHRRWRCHLRRSSDFSARGCVLPSLFHLFLRCTVSGAELSALSDGSTSGNGKRIMPSWNADQYLKFADERTRPCRDLLAAIDLPAVHRLIDLGCGPGNSTSVLAGRWPTAEITGLDNATSMIEVARNAQAQHRWIVGDISEWSMNELEQFDLVFSNAALQWVPDHRSLYPRLIDRVRPGGVLAVQIPANFEALPHLLMRELAPSGLRVKEWHAHDLAFYYDVLSARVSRVDIWQTEYQHVMSNAEAIVEWYKGSGLRPFLEAMAVDQRENFLGQYTERIRAAYWARPDGKVLFPFLRLFVVAYK